MNIRRLGPGDETLARATFAMMATVFDDEARSVGMEYVRQLLARPDFWAIAAVENDEPLGGLTAHVLPMTRSETSELFIYDIAVRTDHQRRGIGRSLMQHLFTLGNAAGIEVSFVPAENEDTHALDFYRSLGGTPTPVTFFTFGE